MTPQGCPRHAPDHFNQKTSTSKENTCVGAGWRRFCLVILWNPNGGNLAQSGCSGDGKNNPDTTKMRVVHLVFGFGTKYQARTQITTLIIIIYIYILLFFPYMSVYSFWFHVLLSVSSWSLSVNIFIYIYMSLHFVIFHVSERISYMSLHVFIFPCSSLCVLLFLYVCAFPCIVLFVR